MRFLVVSSDALCFITFRKRAVAAHSYHAKQDLNLVEKVLGCDLFILTANLKKGEKLLPAFTFLKRLSYRPSLKKLKKKTIEKKQTNKQIEKHAENDTAGEASEKSKLLHLSPGKSWHHECQHSCAG